MKHTIVAVAFALSGLAFTASPVLAETRDSPPNAVDTSQWKKMEYPTCFSNGVQMLQQVFFYENKPLRRMIYRSSVKDKVLYEHHVVESDGEKAMLDAYYIKRGNIWIHYAGDEGEKLDKALDTLLDILFPKDTTMIACEE
jgi:hypothetical protein